MSNLIRQTAELNLFFLEGNENKGSISAEV